MVSRGKKWRFATPISILEVFICEPPLLPSYPIQKRVVIPNEAQRNEESPRIYDFANPLCALRLIFIHNVYICIR